MSFLKRLGSLFGGGPGGDGSALYFAVKCRRCGEIVSVRADKRYDLDQGFDAEADTVTGYVLRKEVLGNHCPQLMRIEVHYDRSHRESKRQAEGCEFASPQTP